MGRSFKQTAFLVPIFKDVTIQRAWDKITHIEFPGVDSIINISANDRPFFRKKVTFGTNIKLQIKIPLLQTCYTQYILTFEGESPPYVILYCKLYPLTVRDTLIGTTIKGITEIDDKLYSFSTWDGTLIIKRHYSRLEHPDD